MSNIQYLESQGLTVILRSRGDYLIYKPGEMSADEVRRYVRVYQQGNKWIFVYWTYIPGPGYDDFFWECKTLDEALVSVQNFYFGEPTIIDNWVFPLNPHPELSVDGIQKVLLQLSQVGLDNFKIIAEKRRLSLGDDWYGWPQSLQWHFLPISHQSDTTSILYLRRDMGEAYVVSQITNA